MPPTSPALPPGTLLRDAYIVHEQMAAGGMGEVYAATHVRLPGRLAIKVLAPHLAGDPAAVARWSAIYIVSCTDGRGILYYEDVPEDVSVAVRSAEGENGALPGTEVDLDDTAPPGELSEADTEPVRAPFLRSVPTDETNPDPDPLPDRAPPVRRRRRPQLKVVK